MEEPKEFASSYTIIDTVSLLSRHCIDVLDLVAPGWQASPLKAENAALSGVWQTLNTCGIKKLGDFKTLTPLALFALAAKIALPPPEGASLWAHLLHHGCEYAALLLKPRLIELLTNFSLQERLPTPKQPPETGYSSLLIQPQEVIDQIAYPDSITILNWPFAGKRPAAFSKGEIRATPLLAGHLQDALCQEGCNLSAVPLTELALSARTANTLARAGDSTLGFLARQTPESLFARPNFGPHAYAEVASALRKYLAPWLAQLPPDTLVPAERRHAFGVETEDEAPVPLPKIRYLKIPDSAPQKQEPAPRQGKNALFFPVDAVLQAFGALAREAVEEYNHPFLSQDEVSMNCLLSGRLLDALAANGCDLMRIPVQELLEDNGDSPATLAVRAQNALIRARIRTVGEIVRCTPAELMSIRNFGVGSYQKLVQRLQAYLQPWLDELGLHRALEGNWSAYEDLPPAKEPPPLEKAEVTLRASGLLGLLDLCEVKWRQMLVVNVCHDLKFGGLSGNLTLGDVIEPGQANEPVVVASAEVANQMNARIQEALIIKLVDHVLQAKLSEMEHLGYQQALANVSVESLLAECIKQYIAFTRKGSARVSFDLPREMKVLLAHAGVIDGQSKTLAELGAMLGLTRARVQQMEAHAEEALQRAPLRPFVEGFTLLVKWAIQAAGGVTTLPQAATAIAGWLPFGALDPDAMTKLLARWARTVSVKGDARLSSSPLGPMFIKKIEVQLEHILERSPGSLPFVRLVDEVLLAGDEQLFSAGREFIAATIRLSDLVEMQEDYCWPRHQGALRAQLIMLLRTLGRPAHFIEITERYQEQFPMRSHAQRIRCMPSSYASPRCLCA